MPFLQSMRWSADTDALAVDPLACILVVLVVGFLGAMPIALVLAVGGIAFHFMTDGAPLVVAPAWRRAWRSQGTILPRPDLPSYKPAAREPLPGTYGFPAALLIPGRTL